MRNDLISNDENINKFYYKLKDDLYRKYSVQIINRIIYNLGLVRRLNDDRKKVKRFLSKNPKLK